MQSIRFNIEMYVTAAGRCPVADFLREVRRSDPRLAADLVGGIEKLRDGGNHRRPLTAPLRDGILELRGRGNAQGRVLFSLESGRIVLLLAGLLKRTGPVPERDLNTALARRRNWAERR